MPDSIISSRARLGGIIAFIIVLCGGGVPCRADDAADILASARRLQAAWGAGNAATVEKHTINDENSTKFVKSICSWIAAQQRLGKAAVSKFGESGKKLQFGINQFDLSKQMDDADIKVNGDTATVTPKAKGEDPAAPGQPSPPTRSAYFKKQDGEWKMDMTKIPQMEHLSRSIGSLPVIAKVADEITQDIEADKFKSVEEVQKTLGQKMSAAVRAARHGAASREKPPEQ